MARGRSGVISKEYKGEDNTAYHDVIKLFKIYRVVNWQMQIKISQVKRRFHMEYGTDVDEFLDTIYQAGKRFSIRERTGRGNQPIKTVSTFN